MDHHARITLLQSKPIYSTFISSAAVAAATSGPSLRTIRPSGPHHQHNPWRKTVIDTGEGSRRQLPELGITTGDAALDWVSPAPANKNTAYPGLMATMTIKRRVVICWCVRMMRLPPRTGTKYRVVDRVYSIIYSVLRVPYLLSHSFRGQVG